MMMLTELQRDAQREIWKAVWMLIDAKRDEDQLRITAAMKHLEFLDSMTRFTVWEDRQ
jgi:hypothetical protein